MRWLINAIIGLLGGLVSGLFGVGGGLLFVPLLILFLGFNSHVAIGTSLLAIIPTAGIGAFRHFAAKSIDIQTALLLAVFAMAGAWVGAGISLGLEAAILRKLYAAFLLVLALRHFFKS